MEIKRRGRWAGARIARATGRSPAHCQPHPGRLTLGRTRYLEAATASGALRASCLGDLLHLDHGH